MTENKELLQILAALTEGFRTLQSELQLTRSELGQKIEQTNVGVEAVRRETKQFQTEMKQFQIETKQFQVETKQFQDETVEILSGLSTFLLSSERGYQVLEQRVYDLEQWRRHSERKDDAG